MCMCICICICICVCVICDSLSLSLPLSVGGATPPVPLPAASSNASFTGCTGSAGTTPHVCLGSGVTLVDGVPCTDTWDRFPLPLLVEEEDADTEAASFFLRLPAKMAAFAACEGEQIPII